MELPTTSVESNISFSKKNFSLLCDELAVKEKAFQNIIEQYGYPPLWTRPATFTTLIHIILEQQVSLASALAAFNKLNEKAPAVTPAALLALTDDEMKACYFSRQKIVYARHLAQTINDGDLVIETLHLLDDNEVSNSLKKIKGIGNWTVDVFLMMALQRTDCFPTGDIALINSMKHELKLPHDTSREELMMIADNWKPYRTIAAYLLWHAYLSRRKKK